MSNRDSFIVRLDRAFTYVSMMHPATTFISGLLLSVGLFVAATFVTGYAVQALFPEQTTNTNILLLGALMIASGAGVFSFVRMASDFLAEFKR